MSYEYEIIATMTRGHTVPREKMKRRRYQEKRVGK